MSSQSAWRGELFSLSRPKSLISSGLQRASHIKVKIIAPTNNCGTKKFRFIEVRDPATSVSENIGRAFFYLRPHGRDSVPFEKERVDAPSTRSEEHTSELQSHSFISYAV